MIATDTMPMPRYTPGPLAFREKPEPLFYSAEAAFRFALSVEGAPKKPGMAARIRSAGEGIRRTLGLEGLDRAAQAGIIESILRRGLSKDAMAALVARCTSRKEICNCGRPCCSKRAHGLRWYEAIDTLQWPSRKALPKTSHSSQWTRREILMLIYEGSAEKSKKAADEIKRIADENSLDVETVRRHYKAIKIWLLGRAAKGAEPGIVGVEQAAWAKAETLLWEAGIVGEVQ